MDKNAIIRAINDAQLTMDELTEILYAVRKVRRAAAKTRATVFNAGDRVSFVYGGAVCRGVIEKMNRASAIVMYNSNPVKVSLISLKAA